MAMTANSVRQARKRRKPKRRKRHEYPDPVPQVRGHDSAEPSGSSGRHHAGVDSKPQGASEAPLRSRSPSQRHRH